MSLVFANKNDLENTMTVAEVAHGLGLYSLGQRPWYGFVSPLGLPQSAYVHKGNKKRKTTNNVEANGLSLLGSAGTFRPPPLSTVTGCMKD